MQKLAKRFASFMGVRGRGRMAAGESGAGRRPQGACGMADIVTHVTQACDNRSMRLTGAGAPVKVGPTMNPCSFH